LTVRDSIFDGNVAGTYGGAVASLVPTQTIERSAFTSNSVLSGVGGAVWPNGFSITVRDSAFALNTAGAGGGIGWEWDDPNVKTLTVTGSTFDRNSAGAGGGLWAYMSQYGHVVVANSTFSGNSGSGISVGMWGTIDVTNSTLAANGGGGLMLLDWGSAASTAWLRNTIFVGQNDWICQTGTGDVINDAGGNLRWNGAGCTAGVGDPKLQPLAANGGPTPTMALGAGSAALNAADAGVCAAPAGPPGYGAGGVDQRGVPRPQGAGCDIGAYEGT
jgi:hypothetical protein